MTGSEQATFCDHMRAGMRRGAAAEAMGLQRASVLDEIAEDPEFEKAVLDAEGEASEHVEEAIYQAAVSGSVAAAKLWLDLRRPAMGGQLVTTESPGAGTDPLAALNNLMAGADD